MTAAPDRRRDRLPRGGAYRLGRSAVWTSAPTVCFSKSLRAGLQWLQAAGGAKHHDRCILLVFRRRRHLLLGQLERDAVALVGNAPEMQRVPFDHDFPAADPEKTAEIYDSRAHRSGAIDDHIDDAPHV